MDFSLILVILTFAMGAIWAVDALVWKPQRARAAAAGVGPGKEPWVVEISRSFFPVVLIVLLVRSFAYEPFRIPSSSMMPTLRVGDFIFVSKFSYGLRLPVLNTKIMKTGEPERGDVIVFRLPSDPHTNYIKRVIGLPGDVVTLVNKQVYVNGKPLPLELTGETHEQECGGFWFTAHVAKETIGDRQHLVYLSEQPDRPSPYLGRPVPEGEYLVMGDNRDCSRDGRYIGYIPEGNLAGRAVRIWMNWDSEQGRPLWNRIGNRIK